MMQRHRDASNLLLQVDRESAREVVLLELVLTSKEKLVEDKKFKGSLDCGNCETGALDPERSDKN